MLSFFLSGSHVVEATKTRQHFVVVQYLVVFVQTLALVVQQQYDKYESRFLILGYIATASSRDFEEKATKAKKKNPDDL